MRHLVEKYVADVGTKTGVLLLGTLLVWVTIVLAVALYALLMGVWTITWLTWAVVGGGGTQIIVAIVLWIFLGLSLLLARAMRSLWLARRSERWRAETALDALEKWLLSDRPVPPHGAGLRERLSVRAVEALELEVSGAARGAEATIEDRLIDLASQSRPDARSGDPT